MQIPTDNLSALARQAGRLDGQADHLNAQTRSQLAKQFEGIFLGLLIKEMRSTSLEGEGLFQGDNSDIYGGMFDQFMAQHLTSGAGMGIAEMLDDQLTNSSPRNNHDQA